jgi:hypothetical protein
MKDVKGKENINKNNLTMSEVTSRSLN